MPLRVGDFLTPQLPASAGRPWYAGLGVSALLHVGAVVALAGLTAASSFEHRHPAVDTRWAADADRDESHKLEVLPADVLPSVLATGGGSGAAATFVRRSEQPLLPVSVADETISAAAPDGILSSDALADDVGMLLSVSSGAADGEGTGEGDGEGDGFFGISAPGKRFVYVVDCSLSMNHPHQSPARTRFKRLKLELIKSIGLMQPPQEFFIIFFNQDVLPMPSRTMQPALPEVKEHYLKWMTKVRADGDTDPRDALRLAMKLDPDVIYFLTDGSFEFAAKRDLNKLAQQRVSIHTFALGNREGEPILKGLAERNRGVYHYIP